MILPNNNYQRWISKIIDHSLTPILSDQLCLNFIAEDKSTLKEWALANNYPESYEPRKEKIAQFISINQGGWSYGRKDYLDFLRQRILTDTFQDINGQSKLYLELIKSEKDLFRSPLSVSQIASRLSSFGAIDEQPLGLLANLPFSTYLTTSSHTFLEDVLRRKGKNPISDFYRWSKKLKRKFPNEEMPYDRDPQRPIVYHLFGVDDKPETLVLNTGDYYDFLYQISIDFRTQKSMPPLIRNVFANTSLLLLGYEWDSWDFQFLFHGPIKILRTGRERGEGKSLCLQLNPQDNDDIQDQEAFENFVNEFFHEYDFQVHWENTPKFLLNLHQQGAERWRI